MAGGLEGDFPGARKEFMRSDEHVHVVSISSGVTGTGDQVRGSD